jgi:uncharacterized protein
LWGSARPQRGTARTPLGPNRTQGKIGFHAGKVAIERPRVRDLAGQELALPSWDRAIAEDWLGKWAMNLMLIKVKEGIEDAGFTSCSLVTASPADLESPSPPQKGEDGLLAKMNAYNRREAARLLAAIQSRSIDRANLPSLLHLILAIDSGERRHYGCGVGKSMAGISITGDVYPCHRFVVRDDFRLGNIDSYRAGIPNAYWSAAVDALPECASCWARYLCGGGCSYHNKALTGDMHKPPPSFCNQRRAMFEGLIHVYCELTEEDRLYVREIANNSSHKAARSMV